MSNSKKPGLTRRASGLMALEQRFMFDGAAVADALAAADAMAVPEPVVPALDLQLASPVTPAAAQTLALAETQAEQRVTEFLSRPDARQQLYALFPGHLSDSEPSPTWQAAVDTLLAHAERGEIDVRVELRSNAELQGAKGAYSAVGTTGKATIYLNADWLESADSLSVTKVLVEEMGHHLDQSINPGQDSPGDEGERFARVVVEGAPIQSVTAAPGDSDHAVLRIEGEPVEVELATYNFTTAYRMVYDLDNSTFGKTSVQITTGDISTTERWADKEQNSHFFHTASLGAVTINDNNFNSALFSGNDVSAIGIGIGGVDYYGWISRPIKSGGAVKGFYFWTDDDFNNNGSAAANLAAAQADGNRDTDGSVLDNRGFLLVVDQTWFAGQTATSYNINNAKDGNLGAISVANVGSSSDRVDSALNSLLPPPNVAPVAVADLANGAVGTSGGAALEAGGMRVNATASLAATGNVLLNDTDADAGDTKTVLKVGTTAANTSVSPSTNNTNGTVIAGVYGSLTMGSDGSYSYAITAAADTLAAMEALRTTGDTLQDRFTYTMKDAAGLTSTTTLTIVIVGRNDHPTANNDYNIARESLLADDNANQYTSTDPVGFTASGNVLSNDTDVDGNNETKTITGTTISGSATGQTSSAGSSLTKLSFSSLPGNVSVGYYVFIDGNNLADNSAGGTLTPLRDSSNNQLKISSIDTTNKTFTLSGAVDNATLTGGTTILGFANKANGTGAYKDSLISASVSTTTTNLSLTANVTGTIAVGMMETSTGAKVASVTYDSTTGKATAVVLEGTHSFTSRTLTFTGSSTASETISGQYGELVLNADGSYVYTPTALNSALDSGESFVDVFNYTMQDAANATSSATLTITVLGSTASAKDPDAKSDGNTATEAGGVSNGTPGVNPQGNVITGTVTTPSGGTGGQADTTPASTGNNFVIAARHDGAAADSALAYVTTTGSISNGSRSVIAVTSTAGLSTGMGVSGTNIASGTTISSISGLNVTLSASASGAASGTFFFTTPSTSTTLVGQYGDLVLRADGGYTYTVRNADPAVQALRTSSDTLADKFLYTITNGQTSSGNLLVDSSTLTITLQGANDAPVASNDAGEAIEAGGQNHSIAGYNPSGNVLTNDTDVDDPASALRVTSYRTGNTEGSGTAATSLGASLSGLYGTLTMTAAGEWSYTLNQANPSVNALIAGGSTLTDHFNYTVTDGTGTGLSDIAVLTVTIQGANDTVAVNNVFVNEGSPYAVFTVTGAPGVQTTLALSNTSGLSPNDDLATLSGPGADIGQQLEYWDAVANDWVDYSSGNVTIPSAGKLLVRVAVNVDNIHESNESFSLVATANGNQAVGIGTINDEGDSEGKIFQDVPPDNTTGNPVEDTLTAKDDDRPAVSIQDVTVTEGGTVEFLVTIDKLSDFDLSFSPFVSITGTGSGFAVLGTDTAATSTLSVSTDGGNSWSAVTGPVTLAAGQSALRLSINTVDDADTEPTETFRISTGSLLFPSRTSAAVTATATILDNEGVPTITPVDGNGGTTGQATVSEAGLTSAGNTTETTTGTITISAANGIDTITVGGTAVPWSTLSGLTSSNTVSIDTGEGTLVLNGYTGTQTGGTLSYSYTLKAALNQTGASSSTDSITLALLDGNNVSSSGNLVILITDDTPSVTISATDDPSVKIITQDADVAANGTDVASSSADLGGIFGATPSYGADGQASANPLVWSYTLNATDGTDSGLKTGGSSIYLYKVGNEVIGSTQQTNRTSNAGDAFTVSISSTGVLSLTQGKAIDHVGTGNGTQILLANGLITLTGNATVTDLDGDTATGVAQTIDLGGNIGFDDVNPSVTVSATDDPSVKIITQDADVAANGTDVASSSADLGGIFGATPSYGADGQASANPLVWSYTLNATDGTDSGLKTGGSSIYLYKVGNEVIGSTQQTNRTSNTGDAFTVSISSTGVLSLTQLKAIDHIGAGNENQILLANGLITLTGNATVTDLDGDTATGVAQTIDLGGNIGFDNEPSITVTGDTYNEASPRAIFTVTANAGQYLTLDVRDVADTSKTATGGNEGGAGDALDTTPIYYSTNGGASWSLYNGTAFQAGGVPVLVAVDITPERDGVYEGEQQLQLVVNAGLSTQKGAFASIVDDGTGKITDAIDANTINPVAPRSGPGAAFDDDRPITVTGDTYNEASPRAIFTVTANAGQYLTLDVRDVADTSKTATGGNEGGAGDALDTTPIYYSTNGGASWSLYNGTAFQAGGVPVLVAVDITPERDGVYEGEQQLQLVVNAGLSTQKGAFASIVDDGTGKITDAIDANTINPVAPRSGPGAAFDDDRPITVTGDTYNEASPRAIFTVTANAGQYLTLDVRDVADTSKTATGGNEGGAGDALDTTPIYYSTNGGASWSLYNGTAFQAGGVPVLVAVDITPERDGVYEGEQQLQLVVNAGLSTQKGAFASIVDDGTGKITDAIDANTINPVAPRSGPGAAFDDDRPITVTGDTYNEASPRAIFTVTANAGQYLTLDVRDVADTSKTATGGNEGGAGDALDTTPIYYSTNGGASWSLYNGTAFQAGGVPVLVAVDITPERDGVYEGEQQLQLVVNAGLSTQKGAFASIVDDGTGKITDAIDANTINPVAPRSGPGAAFDDDRPITVTGDTYNEASPRAIFTVTANAGQYLTLDVRDVADTSKTATGGNEGGAGDALDTTPIYYSTNGGASWSLYNGTAFQAGGVPVLVAVDITPERDGVYEGEQQLQLVVNAGLSTQKGAFASIVDDGTGKITDAIDANTINPVAPRSGPGAAFDDDRPITVTGDTYNEASPRAIFTVTANAGQYLTLDVRDVADTSKTATGGNEGGAGDALDTTPIYYSTNGGASWSLYNGTAFQAGGVPVLVAVDITPERDGVYEGEQQLQLVVNAGLSTQKGAFASIVDDGTGKITDAIDANTINPVAPRSGPGAAFDDDRRITVSGLDDVSEGSNAVFTVTLPDGNARNTEIHLGLSHGNGDDDAEADDYSPAFTAYYFNGSTRVDLPIQNGKVILPAGVTSFLVSVPTTQDRDFEDTEDFSLTATVTGGKSASDTSTILDNGLGRVYDEQGLNPAGPGNDDRPVPAPPPLPPAPVPPAPRPAEQAPPPPPARPAQAFASALTPLAPALVPADPPLALIDAVTRSSGYQIPASETAPQGLSLYQGVTDQFVQTTGTVTRVSLPFDAFIHSNRDAVVRLQAKQADDSNLPSWVQFDATSGVFQVTPPPGFRGKLDLKVIARDDDGREAVAIFQMFVGEQNQQRPQSRESFTDKLRSAGKRPITLVRVADASERPVPRDVPLREAMPARARAG